MIDWSFFPRTDPLPKFLEKTINVFNNNHKKIDSSKNDNNELRLKSDQVLRLLQKDFLEIGYAVEKGKKKEQKIRVPVIFGKQGKVNQAFEVDGWNKDTKVVMEIEAGRAYSNHQFLKDIFEASVMVDVQYLVLAVRKVYNKQKDYQIISDWLDTLYITNRIKFDLKGILLIGY